MWFGQMSSNILLFQPFKSHCCMLTSKKDTLVKFCILDFMRLRGAIPLLHTVLFIIAFASLHNANVHAYSMYGFFKGKIWLLLYHITLILYNSKLEGGRNMNRSVHTSDIYTSNIVNKQAKMQIFHAQKADYLITAVVNGECFVGKIGII